MTIIFEERPSDSPYVEKITRGWTASDGSSVRPAECCWHMVFVRHQDNQRPMVVGPWTAAGVASWKKDAEILWIKFKLGAFMPHLPAKVFLDRELILPEGSSHTFWLNGSAWQFPDYENVETFVARLVREGMLVQDPVVNAALHGRPPEIPARTVRHRFSRVTGLSQSHIYQFDRAQRAAALLRQGVSILDAVFELGYFDQPHLTRSMRRWIGHTPAEIVQLNKPALPREEHANSYKTAPIYPVG